MTKRSFIRIKKAEDYQKLKEIMSNANVSPENLERLSEVLKEHEFFAKTVEEVLDEYDRQTRNIFNLVQEILPPEINSEPTSKQGQQVKNNSDHNPENSNKNNESSKNLKNDPGEKPQPPAQNPKKGYSRAGQKKLPQGNTIRHKLFSEDKLCPCCHKNMHKQRTKTRTYVISIPLLSTETHTCESYRCLSCDTEATAKRNDNLENECIGRYHFSAVSALAALRYQCGMASYRMENMSDSIGIKVSDSTQWSLFEGAASQVQPFVCFLEKTLAHAPLKHADDTHNIVLSIVKEITAEQERALNNGKNPEHVRSGIHTTNVTGVYPQGEIVLFKTGLHHSGEIIAKILAARTIEDQIILMSDASSSNTSEIDLEKNKNFVLANCNSHALRKFKELAKSEEDVAKKYRIKNHKISEPIVFFLEKYAQIFKNDKKTKEMTKQERLLFHKKNSFPLMEEMKNKIELAVLKNELEPNEKTFTVYKYFKNHYEKLCAFCHFEGAPVCNNLSERMLKSIIRHRKNSLFFRTQTGASVADTLTTILFTAKANNINSVEYLKNLLLYQSHWKENLEQWLPWNYETTIAALKNIPTVA